MISKMWYILQVFFILITTEPAVFYVVKSYILIDVENSEWD